MILVGIEYAFNVFPATPVSSAVLQVCHLVLLGGLLAISMDGDDISTVSSSTKEVTARKMKKLR